MLDERAIDREVCIIKGAGGKSGVRVPKAAELIAGDLLHVSDSRLSFRACGPRNLMKIAPR